MEIKKLLEDIESKLDSIKDENAKSIIILLFNIIEKLNQEKEQDKKQIIQLKNEISQLKGEQKQPEIKPKNRKPENISSEKERKLNQQRPRKINKKSTEIHKTKKCEIDKTTLPKDVIFKGYKSFVVQDIKIVQENTEFLREIYYSPSQKKTFTAKLPKGYNGSFGPNLKTFIITLKNAYNITEPKILDLLKTQNIQISNGSISNILIKNKEQFKQEKKEIYEAGLSSTSHQQIDDTSSRVNGENHYTNIVCNDFYTAYFTTKHKNRLTILDILRNFKSREYCFNLTTLILLKKMGVSKNIINHIETIKEDKIYTQEEIEKILEIKIPKLGKNNKLRILEASGITAYQKQTKFPVIEILVCDDAPQFKLLTMFLALCWIHDARHYKKLNPIISRNRNILKKFMKEYWKFYRKLLKFKKKPTEKKAKKLEKDFDELFKIQTDYEELNDRIKKTLAKKKELLLVLKFPQIPLHNNASELGARARVRKRDISFQTRTDEGTCVCDAFLTIVETAKKLSVNIYDYIFDRISESYKLPSLAEIIKIKSLEIR
ncbi:transposase [archaeon]|jgi:hypothetical protein|nr:transposase [archaeon]